MRVEGNRALSGDTGAEHRIQGHFDKIINSSDPVFLFGELGSGKSTIVANYMLEILSNQPEIIPVFLSSGYLQDKAISSLEEIIAVVNQFVNNELPLTDKIFDLNVIFKTNKEVIVVFDGLDELPIRKARQLVTNLKRLQQNNKRLKIIATGRPVELQGILPAGWHSYCDQSRTCPSPPARILDPCRAVPATLPPCGALAFALSSWGCAAPAARAPSSRRRARLLLPR